MHGSHALRIVVSLFVVAVGLLVPALPASAAGAGELTMTMTAAPQPVGSGGTITYTLNVANPHVYSLFCLGPTPNSPCRKVVDGIDANFVLLNVFLPPNVTFQSAQPDSGFGCGLTGSVVVCNGGFIPKGGQANIIIKVTAPTLSAQSTPITLTNTATVTPGSPQTGSVTASVQTTVNPPLFLRARIAGPTSVRVGDTPTYQVAVDNLGAVPVSNVATLFQTALPAQAISGLTSLNWGCFIQAAASPRLMINCNATTIPAFSSSSWSITMRFASIGGQCGGVSVLLDPNNVLPGPKDLISDAMSVCIVF